MPFGPHYSRFLALSLLITASLSLSAMAGDEVPLPMIYSAITTTVEPSTQPLRPFTAKQPLAAPLALVAVAPGKTPVANKPITKATTKPAATKAATTSSKATAKPVDKAVTPAAPKALAKALAKAVLTASAKAKTLAPKAIATSKAASMPVTPPLTADLQTQPFLSVPIVVSGDAAGKALPETYSTAAAVLSDIQKTPNISVHMEVLRRAGNSLPGAQYPALIKGIQNRHLQQPSNALRQLDWGYTKLVFEHNKAGLFYLRKAHDELQSPISALTYGLAQAAVDTLVEKAPTSKITMRKLDVQHKLDDALLLHSKHPVTGFWPTYRMAMNKLALIPAYTDWVATDRSETLVPTGDTVEIAYNFLASAQTTPPPLISENSLALTTPEVCNRPPFTETFQKERAWTPKDAMKTLGISIKGSPATAYVFQAGASPQTVPTLVVVQNNSLLGTVTTRRVPYVLEDINHDDTPELVVRQFLTDATTPPLGATVTGPVEVSETPLQVYRFDGCQYELDKTVSSLFD
ncbi:MAG: hypothetical protein QE263_05995 [Vampirovibrionales bacterium]|nr:hypothetical protein [Vampirovibrionales bacterium]